MLKILFCLIFPSCADEAKITLLTSDDRVLFPFLKHMLYFKIVKKTWKLSNV